MFERMEMLMRDLHLTGERPQTQSTPIAEQTECRRSHVTTVTWPGLSA